MKLQHVLCQGVRLLLLGGWICALLSSDRQPGGAIAGGEGQGGAGGG